jgi:hypothetical protein
MFLIGTLSAKRRPKAKPKEEIRMGGPGGESPERRARRGGPGEEDPERRTRRGGPGEEDPERRNPEHGEKKVTGILIVAKGKST